MSSPPPTRLALACLALVGPLALIGCGNRGELYLEPAVDTAAEADLELLEGESPGGGPAPDTGVDPATEPSPLVPGEGVAPSVAPDPAGDPEREPEDDEDEDEDE